MESLEEVRRVAGNIGYPIMLRIGYALGGLGSGICGDEETLLALPHVFAGSGQFQQFL